MTSDVYFDFERMEADVDTSLYDQLLEGSTLVASDCSSEEFSDGSVDWARVVSFDAVTMTAVYSGGESTVVSALMFNDREAWMHESHVGATREFVENDLKNSIKEGLITEGDANMVRCSLTTRVGPYPEVYAKAHGYPFSFTTGRPANYQAYFSAFDFLLEGKPVEVLCPPVTSIAHMSRRTMNEMCYCKRNGQWYPRKPLVATPVITGMREKRDGRREVVVVAKSANEARGFLFSDTVSECPSADPMQYEAVGDDKYVTYPLDACTNCFLDIESDIDPIEGVVVLIDGQEFKVKRINTIDVYVDSAKGREFYDKAKRYQGVVVGDLPNYVGIIEVTANKGEFVKRRPDKLEAQSGVQIDAIRQAPEYAEFSSWMPDVQGRFSASFPVASRPVGSFAPSLQCFATTSKDSRDGNPVVSDLVDFLQKGKSSRGCTIKDIFCFLSMYHSTVSLSQLYKCLESIHAFTVCGAVFISRGTVAGRAIGAIKSQTLGSETEYVACSPGSTLGGGRPMERNRATFGYGFGITPSMCPHAVACVIFVNGSMLATKAEGAGFWDVAMVGMVHCNETYAKAFLRELKEETGITAAYLRPDKFGISRPNNALVIGPKAYPFITRIYGPLQGAWARLFVLHVNLDFMPELGENRVGHLVTRETVHFEAMRHDSAVIADLAFGLCGQYLDGTFCAGPATASCSDIMSGGGMRKLGFLE